MEYNPNISGPRGPDSNIQHPNTGHLTTTTTNTTTTSSPTSTTSRAFPTITSTIKITRDTSGNKVNVMRTFQEMFENAKIAFDRINFYSNFLIDRAQIEQFENMYRELDFYINSLLPYFGLGLDIRGIIYDIRNLQTQIEDRLINFYQNLSEREKIKVIFTLPHLQNRSFVQAVNSLAGHLDDLSVNQSVSQPVNQSVNRSVHQSDCQSVSFNNSLGQKSPNNDFAHIGTSPLKQNSSFLVNSSRENSSPSKVSTKIRAKFSVFLKRKSELEVEVSELLNLAIDEKVQPSTLKLRALDLKSRLTSLGIDRWINDDKICQIDPLELSNWEDNIGKQISNVLYQSEEKINIRKGLAQSGLKKRDPPSFSGSVLDFPLFKKNWAIEVSQGGLPELIELNYLKTAVPSSAKDRLYEVETLEEAWSILNKIYGKEFDLRNKLKQEFLAISISAKTSPFIEIEIYQKVHKLASRIKAAKAQNLLESDFEYISLVYQFLPESQKEKWISMASSSSSNPTWDSFYTFLEEVYERALLKKQINESCKQSSQIKVCTKCKRTGHLADKCYEGKVLTTVVGVENCPVCDGDLHQIEIKVSDGSRKQIIADRLHNCIKYDKASDDEKRAIYLRVKSKFNKFCKHCSSWRHD